MTKNRLPSAVLSHLANAAEPANPRAVAEVLEAAGVAVLSAAAAGGEPPEATVHAFDGKLNADVGALLRSRTPAYFLACAGQVPSPNPVDVRVLSTLLRRATLLPDFEGVQRYYVGSLESLRGISERVAVHLEGLGAARSAAEASADVMYELAANALLDAPAGPDGAPKYAHRRDDPSLRIAAEDAAVIAFGVHGSRAFLGAFDRFGRLTPEPLARTIEGLGGRAKVNDSGGGAGLGLRRIVEKSELVAARVIPGQATEMLCTVELGDMRRRAAAPKSVFFSVERG